MTKKRRLNADEKWLLAIAESTRISYGNLCTKWARERGTKGNVVTWPKPVVSAALKELLERELVRYTPPERKEA